MAAACSAALHVVGQKCCDDGTARLATFRAKRGLSALSLGRLVTPIATSVATGSRTNAGSGRRASCWKGCLTP